MYQELFIVHTSSLRVCTVFVFGFFCLLTLVSSAIVCTLLSILVHCLPLCSDMISCTLCLPPGVHRVQGWCPGGVGVQRDTH